nr:hypothetical protein HK105_000327 [Polyrhizophydium stewartii]
MSRPAVTPNVADTPSRIPNLILRAKELRINWAIPSSQPHKNEIVNHHHIFVGDLGPGVTDQILAKAFSQFGTLSDARVMWDHTTGKSRGYGFVAFRERKDAERAISEMNGEWLGNRPIRCNWANQKSQPEHSTTHTLTYEAVAAESSPFNTTVYVGNLAPGTSREPSTSSTGTHSRQLG